MNKYETIAKVFHLEHDFSFKQQNKEVLIEYFTSQKNLKGLQLKIIWDAKLLCTCKCFPGFRVKAKVKNKPLKTYLIPKEITTSSNIDEFLI